MSVALKVCSMAHLGGMLGERVVKLCRWDTIEGASDGVVSQLNGYDDRF